MDETIKKMMEEMNQPENIEKVEEMYASEKVFRDYKEKFGYEFPALYAQGCGYDTRKCAQECIDKNKPFETGAYNEIIC